VGDERSGVMECESVFGCIQVYCSDGRETKVLCSHSG